MRVCFDIHRRFERLILVLGTIGRFFVWIGYNRRGHVFFWYAPVCLISIHVDMLFWIYSDHVVRSDFIGMRGLVWYPWGSVLLDMK